MSAGNQRLADWTTGTPVNLYQRCSGCGRTWYFRRTFCPGCGLEHPQVHPASGLARVEAVTTVVRAPSNELRAYTPYCIVIVSAAEGFAMMGQGESGLKIGDQVVLQ